MNFLKRERLVLEWRESMRKEGRQIVTRDYSTARVIELWGRVIDDVLKLYPEFK